MIADVAVIENIMYVEGDVWNGEARLTLVTVFKLQPE